VRNHAELMALGTGCTHWGRVEPSAQLRLGGFQRLSQQAGFEGKSILLMVHRRH
jgi:hypothetical protein